MMKLQYQLFEEAPIILRDDVVVTVKKTRRTPKVRVCKETVFKPVTSPRMTAWKLRAATALISQAA